jgi:hypothetical protein
MKKLFVLTVAFLTLLTMGAFAQDQSAATSKKSSKKSSAASSETGSTAKAAGKSMKLTGTIGQDGKTFTNDADQSSWTISNPDKVKGHEGHHVIVRGKTDDAAKSIDITSVTMAGAKSSGGKKKASEKTPTSN